MVYVAGLALSSMCVLCDMARMFSICNYGGGENELISYELVITGVGMWLLEGI